MATPDFRDVKDSFVFANTLSWHNAGDDDGTDDTFARLTYHNSHFAQYEALRALLYTHCASSALFIVSALGRFGVDRRLSGKRFQRFACPQRFQRFDLEFFLAPAFLLAVSAFSASISTIFFAASWSRSVRGSARRGCFSPR